MELLEALCYSNCVSASPRNETACGQQCFMAVPRRYLAEESSSSVHNVLDLTIRLIRVTMAVYTHHDVRTW